MKMIAGCLVILVITAVMAVAAEDPKPKQDQPEFGRLVVMETSKGTIKIALYEKDAPITTKNFIDLINRKFYDGLKFHRVVPGFVIQGGDPKGDGTGGSEKTIPLETSPKLKFDAAGVVAMARTQDPNSATSQFFITLEATPFLNPGPNGPGYAIFGWVTEGLDIVKKIEVGDVMKTVRMVPTPETEGEEAAEETSDSKNTNEEPQEQDETPEQE